MKATLNVCAPVYMSLRRALALPLYVVALATAYSSDLIGALAAKIAGDD
jgi:hypothetical protein